MNYLLWMVQHISECTDAAVSHRLSHLGALEEELRVKVAGGGTKGTASD